MLAPERPRAATIAVSIVNYRSADLVVAALPALLDELARFERHAVVIVDNASPGDDAERLAAHVAAEGLGDRVRLVRSPRNGGFAAGNNLAFAEIAGLEWTPDAVLLLNPDAEVRPGAVEEMARVMASGPRIGVVGARLANPDGSTWVAAFNFPSALSEFAMTTGLGTLIRRFPRLIADAETPVRCDWVSGAAMLVRREALADVGGMDEGYFLYFEEIDFMHRLAEAGWETWHAPHAVIAHAAGSSTGMLDGKPLSGRMPDYWFASWRRYFSKFHGPAYARIAAALRLLGMGVGWTQRRLRGRPYPLAEGFWRDFAVKALFGRMTAPSRGRAP